MKPVNPSLKKSRYFIPDAPFAMLIQQKLHELDFALDPPLRVANATQIRLKCGALISVYDSGKVVAGGRLIESVAEESLALLRLVLPSTTYWQCGTRR